MKIKKISILIAAILLLSLFPLTAYAAWTDGLSYDASYAFDGGSGTEADPYIINTAASLAQLAVNVNDAASPLSYSGVYFRLDADLDLAGDTWVPIGAWAWGSLDGRDPFSGNFDGNGHTISNMTVSEPSLIGAGLFGYTSGALIEDLGIVNCDVTGQGMVGGLAGFADELTSIHNCYTTGTVTAVYTDGAEGYNGDIAGGLVGNYGDALTSIDGCYSTADVDGDRFVGGLVGYMSAAHIMNSYATGNVGSPTSKAYDAGGFIGCCDQSVIENCYATGSVISTGSAGGFVGSTYSNGDDNQIVNCYARGNVTGCYTDPTDGSWGWATGGFIGSIADTDISNCYSTGYISYAPATEAYYIGGFAGELNGNITFTSCFVDTQAAGREAVGNGDDETSAASAGITGLTTANMQGYDALVNTAKADVLDSGAGASVWYAHSGANYPDFNPESCDIGFDSQGATTPAAPSTVTAIVGLPIDSMPTEPVRSNFNFGGWWTNPFGLGTEFTGSTLVPGDTVVFALWRNDYTASVYVGGRVTLAPVGQTGGAWSYDDVYVTLEHLGDGTVRVTGVTVGTTQVIYIAPETVEVFDITILDSGLPATGQDATLIYILAGTAALLAAAGTLILRRREKRV